MRFQCSALSCTLVESLSRRMMQWLKRWSRLKLYIARARWSKGTLKAKVLRWQRHFEGKGPSMAGALWRQRHSDGKGPSMSKARPLWRQKQFKGKSKGNSEGKEWIVRPQKANILFSYNQSSLGTVMLEGIALPESLSRRMLQCFI
jgi:hypothetical protein